MLYKLSLVFGALAWRRVNLETRLAEQKPGVTVVHTG